MLAATIKSPPKFGYQCRKNQQQGISFPYSYSLRSVNVKIKPPVWRFFTLMLPPCHITA